MYVGNYPAGYWGEMKKNEKINIYALIIKCMGMGSFNETISLN